MNISTSHRDENPYPNKPSGGYEWWYFDAISDDNDWSFVIIFYQGNPFSPKYIEQIKNRGAFPADFPAVSISVYNRNSTEFYSFLEYSKDDFSFNDETDEFRFGTHVFKKEISDDNLIYTLQLDEQLPSGHSLKAHLKFSCLGINDILFKTRNTELEHHFWNLIQPRANVSGSLEFTGKSDVQAITFKGTGYHDHNVGLEPMQNDFEDWYWGRYHFKDYTLIYYVMNRKNDKQYQAWLINNDNQQIIDTFTSAELDGKLTNLFGLKSARKVILKSDTTDITIQTALPIDNGPFYQRFLGQAVMNRGDSISVTEGISEYIYPSNIYNKKYWPAVKMRLRFNYEKPHWVQKFKLLYQWTW